MSLAYRIAKNWTLPIASLVLAVSLLGLVVGLDLLVYVSLDAQAVISATLREWKLWILILGAIGALVGAYYVGDQVLKRRKFERLLRTDKKSDFVAARKDLEDLARRLPDRYRPRFLEKEASFRSKR